MKTAALSLLLLLVPLTAHARPREIFVPARLSSFDGQGWNGLILGQTTFKQIRARFETGKGAYQRSTELTGPKNSPVRVDLLWNKEGREEVLRAITLRYRSNAPTDDDVAQTFGEGEALYLRGRFSDWRVVRFPERGVAAFELRTNDFNGVPLVVLCSPRALNALPGLLTDEEVPVEERIDPHADEPKVAAFGSVTVDVDCEKGLDFPEWLRRDLRADLRDATAGGSLEYRSGSLGSYDVTIRGTGNEDGDGKVSARATIQASGPYGPISATGDGSSSWDRPTKESDRRRGNARSAWEKAVRDARRSAEDSFARQMAESGPPSLASIREAQWNELIGILRAPPTQQPKPETPAGF